MTRRSICVEGTPGSSVSCLARRRPCAETGSASPARRAGPSHHRQTGGAVAAPTRAFSGRSLAPAGRDGALPSLLATIRARRCARARVLDGVDPAGGPGDLFIRTCTIRTGTTAPAHAAVCVRGARRAICWPTCWFRRRNRCCGQRPALSASVGWKRVTRLRARRPSVGAGCGAGERSHPGDRRIRPGILNSQQYGRGDDPCAGDSSSTIGCVTPIWHRAAGRRTIRRNLVILFSAPVVCRGGQKRYEPGAGDTAHPKLQPAASAAAVAAPLAGWRAELDPSTARVWRGDDSSIWPAAGAVLGELVATAAVPHSCPPLRLALPDRTVVRLRHGHFCDPLGRLTGVHPATDSPALFYSWCPTGRGADGVSRGRNRGMVRLAPPQRWLSTGVPAGAGRARRASTAFPATYPGECRWGLRRRRRPELLLHQVLDWRASNAVRHSADIHTCKVSARGWSNAGTPLRRQQLALVDRAALASAIPPSKPRLPAAAAALPARLGATGWRVRLHGHWRAAGRCRGLVVTGGG